MADRITPQARPIDVLNTTIHELHPRYFLTMVDTILNIQISDLNSKPHGRKSLRNLIDCAIGSQLYPPPGSLHSQLICLGQFHGPTHINCEKKIKVR